MIPPPLLPVLQHLRSKPSRTWSIVATVYGDAIVPRGGAVSLATLLTVFDALGIAGTVVRTAMWRLAGDGLLERTRVGRNSFYRLTPQGQALFLAATGRIYGVGAQAWDGHLRLVLPDGVADRDAARAALDGAGFGQAAPGVWVSPSRAALPEAAAGSITLDTVPSVADGRRLAWKAWPLARTVDAYRRFMEVFRPLQDWVLAGQDMSHLDALVARTLLLHEYRRVVLRDPSLPDALLPPDWPGAPARNLVAALYHALLPGSERWLDGGLADDGPLPKAGPALWRRFQD